MIKAEAPEDVERMMARMAPEERFPFDDPAPLRAFPKYARPQVKVAGIYGEAVGWTSMYGLIEWLDPSAK